MRLSHLLVTAAVWQLTLCPLACTGTELADLKTADDVVLAGLPVACAIADTLDPTGATVVCAVLDGLGNLVANTTQTLSSPAVATALVKAHPATATQASSLKLLARKVLEAAVAPPPSATAQP
jgi:hypothetical protein